ncbi:MAG TPA: glutamate-1-semialdehyde 2,1-aminomutase [Phycisphaerae bacterium]|nr:glutamate-1-semialdehyde 2,1-aminomutase [Phycisphaerae bacterium]
MAKTNKALFAKSAAAHERAARVLVGGVDSPVRAFRAVGGHPVFVARAAGARIWDVDGNEYVDLVGSWGPAIVGHAHPAVVEAVQKAAADGLSFGACCAAEAELAEIIVAALPAVEMVRFVSSGTEACMSACRLARAATGRAKIIKFIGCYHGHSDAMLVSAGSGAATFGTPDSAGVPADAVRHTLLAPYNDLAAVERIMTAHGRDLAGIFVEPVAGNMGYVAPQPGFLEGLRRLCDHYGSLLIFDEVMTGFRVAWGGYQRTIPVRPDITCLGKVIGGGMPVAAYGGPRRIMELVSPLGPMYQAGTLSGNPVAMAAGIATLKLCRETGFYDRLQRQTTRLIQGLQAAAETAGVPFQANGTGGMLGFFFADRPVRNFADAQAADHARFAKFFQAMLERGVWLPPSGYEAMFVSAAHDDAAIDHVVSAAAESLRSNRS